MFIGYLLATFVIHNICFTVLQLDDFSQTTPFPALSPAWSPAQSPAPSPAPSPASSHVCCTQLLGPECMNCFTKNLIQSLTKQLSAFQITYEPKMTEFHQCSMSWIHLNKENDFFLIERNQLDIEWHLFCLTDMQQPKAVVDNLLAQHRDLLELDGKAHLPRVRLILFDYQMQSGLTTC